MVLSSSFFLLQVFVSLLKDQLRLARDERNETEKKYLEMERRAEKATADLEGFLLLVLFSVVKLCKIFRKNLF